MQLKTRTWFLISLMFFVAAAIFWQLGERKAARDKAARIARESAAAAATNGPAPAGVALPGQPTVPPAATATTNAALKNPFAHRLSNTARTMGQLQHSESAILLRNALIDSTQPVNLAIPPHLRADGDPGSYVVQSRGPMTDGYRDLLQIGRAHV